MKALLVLILVATLSGNAFAQSNNTTAAEDFMRGFFKGLGETKSADDMKKCIHDINDAINKIVESFKLIITFEFENIIKGMQMFLDAMKEFNEAIEPCMNGYLVLEKLVKAILNSDFNRTMQKIMDNLILYVGYIHGFIQDMQNKEYESAGKNLGALLRSLFLSEVFAEDYGKQNALDFLKGFIEGLGGHFNATDFDPCVKDIQHIVDAIKLAIQSLMSGEFDKVLEGVRQLIQAANQLLNDINKCAKGVKVIGDLINAIRSANPIELAWKIIDNFGNLVNIFNKIISCIGDEDFYCVGNSFGNLLKILFL